MLKVLTNYRMITIITRLCLKFFLTIFFVVSFVSLARPALAYIEDFNGSFTNPVDWEMSTASGTLSFTSSHLNLTNIGQTYSFPYVRSTKNLFPISGPFSVTIDFNFFSNGNFGDGLAISPNPPPFGTVLGPNHKQYILFLVWKDPGGIKLYTTTCSVSSPGCNNGLTNITIPFSSDFNDRSLILNMDNDGTYHLSFRVAGVTSEVFTSSPNQPRPFGIWFGSPETTLSLDYWNSLAIDKLTIETPTPSPTPTPTPTPTPEPTPEPLRPVIILPGSGASWDFGAILNGTAGTNWQIPSFVTLYKNLIDSLENVGYVEGENLFVFGYDWRKGLNDLANDLSGYINGLITAGKIGADDKIDFIGHSYGGLVARTYGQKIGTEKVDKIATAGSPHQGVIDAYGIWEGATIWKNVWWQRAALELQIKLNQQPGENRVATARRLAPGIKDTLPTFDFLKKNDVLISSNSLLQKNAILADLNMDVSTISPLLWANGGNGNQTDRFLKTADRSWLDKALGQWEDGKPIASPFETTDEGDGAVLALSSTNLFVNNALLAANHEQIIANQGSLEKIFEELGLDKTKVVVDTAIDSRKNVFIASLRSPGDLHVCDGAVCDENLGIYLPNEKLFFLPGYEDQALTAIVNADGETGKYLLYIGEMNEGLANWVDQRGSLSSPTQVDTYQVTATDGEMTIAGGTGEEARSFDEDVNSLNGLIPNWDKKKLAIARSESQPLKKRIMAIRQLRELLSKQAVKAYKNNGSDKIEAVIDVWEDIDDLAETVIGSGNTTKAVVLNANVNQVEKYKTLADYLLKNSSSYYAGTFYNLFDKRFTEAKEIKTTKRDLSLDKTLSARYLLLTALGVR